MSDEPDISDALRDVLRSLTARHDVLWALVTDMPPVGPESGRSYDAADGQFLLPPAALDRAVSEAYQRSEDARRQHLSEFLTVSGVPHARIGGSAGIKPALTAMTGVYARAR